MRSVRLLLTVASVGLTAGLFSACSDQVSTPDLTPAQSRVVGDPSLLSAHGPHGPGTVVPLQAPDPANSYTGLDAAAAAGNNGSLHLTLDASGPIPRFAAEFISSVPVFGYAWVDLETGTGIVAVIHPAIGRDSKQRPDGWHTHDVTLGAGTGTSDFCILALGRRESGISFQGDELRLASPLGGISVDALDVAASFTVQADGVCESGLGVDVIDTAGL